MIKIILFAYECIELIPDLACSCYTYTYIIPGCSLPGLPPLPGHPYLALLPAYTSLPACSKPKTLPCSRYNLCICIPGCCLPGPPPLPGHSYNTYTWPCFLPAKIHLSDPCRKISSIHVALPCIEAAPSLHFLIRKCKVKL